MGKESLPRGSSDSSSLEDCQRRVAVGRRLRRVGVSVGVEATELEEVLGWVLAGWLVTEDMACMLFSRLKSFLV